MNRRELLVGLAAVAYVPARARQPKPPLVLLLYAERPEPERSLIAAIAGSFVSETRRLGINTLERSLPLGSTVSSVSALLGATKPTIVVSLGRFSLDLLQKLQPSARLLAGAVNLAVPSADAAAGNHLPQALQLLGGISLVVDPMSIVSTLTTIAPRIRQLSVVINQDRFAWLQPHIESAAKAKSLQLTIRTAAKIGDAAGQYLNILQNGNPETDSLWLLDQPEFLTPDVLPTIIEESWSRNFVVFSSVLAHVADGALFAPYLNPKRLGAGLAGLVAGARLNRPTLKMDEDPNWAINMRTARHLSPVVDSRALSMFNLLLGEQ